MVPAEGLNGITEVLQVFVDDRVQPVLEDVVLGLTHLGSAVGPGAGHLLTVGPRQVGVLRVERFVEVGVDPDRTTVRAQGVADLAGELRPPGTWLCHEQYLERSVLMLVARQASRDDQVAEGAFVGPLAEPIASDVLATGAHPSSSRSSARRRL